MHLGIFKIIQNISNINAISYQFLDFLREIQTFYYTARVQLDRQFPNRDSDSRGFHYGNFLGRAVSTRGAIPMEKKE